MKERLVLCYILSLYSYSFVTAKCPWIFFKVGVSDGFGGETMARIGLMAYAKARGYTYCHSEYKNLHHIRGMDEKFEQFMNLSGAARTLFGDTSECRKSKYRVNLSKSLDPKHNRVPCRKNHPTVGVCKKRFVCSSIFVEDPNLALPILPALRSAFTRSQATTKLKYFNSAFQSVAIHVRRGDAPSSRATTNSEIEFIIEKLLEMYGKRIHFYVFSQGVESDFKFLLEKNKVTLHISESTGKNSPSSAIIANDLKDTFMALASADILVVANSAFSYTAALYNTGSVYYVYRRGGPFNGVRSDIGFKPLSSWIPLK